MPDLLGQSIGRYHITEQLGQGGMATVYKAYDTRLESEVAVKVIRTDMFPPAALERVLKRFEREAKALARLTHPNIVSVLDYGEHDGAPYLIMKYLPGGTLKDRLGQPMPYPEAAHLLAPVARALAYAHQQGILHRDVKPSNILITQSGEPVLTDFGIAKLLESTESHTLTGTGLGVGTPEYMAPEQGLGKAIDGRADVYALGIVFYELVTGRKPFSADTPLAVLYKQMNDPLPRPRDYVPDLPEAVERVLFKALAKQPGDRYEDMGAFANVLEKLNQSLGQPNTQTTLTQKSISNRSGPHDKVQTQDKFLMAGDHTFPENITQTETKTLKFIKKAAVLLAGLALLVMLILGIFLPGISRARHISATQTAASKSADSAKTAPMQKTNQVFAVIDVKTVTSSTLTPPSQQALTFSPTASPKRDHYATGESFVREKDGMPMVYIKRQDHHDFWFDQNLVTNMMFSDFVAETGYITNAEKIDASFVATVKQSVGYELCIKDCEGLKFKPKQGCEAHCSSSAASSSIYAYNESYWRLVAGENWKKPLADGEANMSTPVVHVSWNDANEYCIWVGGKLPSKTDAAAVNQFLMNNSYFSDTFWEWLHDPDENRSGLHHIYGKFSNSLFPNPDTTTFYSNRSRNLLGFRCIIE